MHQSFIGRQEEQAILQKALQSPEAEMIALIGRRRVGKTFLVRSVYENRLDFEITGIQDVSLREQLENFATRLNAHAKPLLPFRRPADWADAFQMLITFLEGREKQEKMVVFFDELPWLATRKSNFLKWLGYFWNSWAAQKNIVVVICGSAASWMVANVVRDRGGLHNRITRRINLMPFNLAETELYFNSRDIRFDRYQIIQIYMAIGGIPHYLKEVESGKSAAQNIDQICFSANGLLNDEFSLLYPALFDNPEAHTKIIRALAKTWQGMTRNDLIEATKLPNGGNTTRAIEELVISGFVSSFYAFGKKKKEIRYRLTDEYSLFYLKFIETNRSSGKGTWQRLSQTQTWKSWSGYAFENIGQKHVAQLKKALGISGVYSEASSFYVKGDAHQPGVQIDLLIDRNDHVINLCELKFYNADFIRTKDFAKEIRTKIALFKTISASRKQLFLTLLTTFPMLPNEHSLGLVDSTLTMDVLFEMV
ncbi:MAG: ATP-binding protein [Saprospiraceae bacterium]|nr:ATP-binding protein [Saprospiraceae bacterium]